MRQIDVLLDQYSNDHRNATKRKLYQRIGIGY